MRRTSLAACSALALAALAAAARADGARPFGERSETMRAGDATGSADKIEAFERMANLATKAGVEGKSRFKIHTPLIRMTKAEIIRTGRALGVDFSLTWSCYEPTRDGRACGLCDSCALRKKGFVEAGFTDPLPYAT